MKLNVCWLVIWMFCSTLSAQNSLQKSPYLFDEFQECLIIYKDGRQFTAPVNYDLIQKQYVFKDPDQQEKTFSNPELIAILRIGKRTFLTERQAAVEVIQVQPKFYVIYTGNTRKAPQKISYGGSTQTASVESYSRLAGTGIASGVQDSQRIISEITRTYEVCINKKTKRFYHKKSFLKLFPKDRQNELSQYIDDHHIDFNSVEQVFKLVQASDLYEGKDHSG